MRGEENVYSLERTGLNKNKNKEGGLKENAKLTMARDNQYFSHTQIFHWFLSVCRQFRVNIWGKNASDAILPCPQGPLAIGHYIWTKKCNLLESRRRSGE